MRNGAPGCRADVRGLELREVDGGTVLRLKVKAGARRNALVGVHAGALKLAVTAAAERGRANQAVLRLLADQLRLPPSALELVAGTSSPDKTVWVPLLAATLVERLAVDDSGRSVTS